MLPPRAEIVFVTICLGLALQNAWVLKVSVHLQDTQVEEIPRFLDEMLKMKSQVGDVFRSPLGVFLLQLLNHFLPAAPIH